MIALIRAANAAVARLFGQLGVEPGDDPRRSLRRAMRDPAHLEELCRMMAEELHDAIKNPEETREAD